MKFTLIFILLGCLHSTASVYSQTKNLTLRMTNAKIVDVLDKIEQKSEFYFLYRSDLFNNKQVSIDFKEKKIDEILEDVLNLNGFDYNIEDKTVIITIKQVEEAVTVKKPQTDKNRIVGTVKDEDGIPLPGVTVMIVGSTQGMVTSPEGKYSIVVAPDEKLQFSFIGMETKVVDPAGRRVVDVILKGATENLEDVTVVAFGKQKKESVVASITTVKADELKIPSSNLTNSFAGRMSGVIAVQRSGEPGADGADFWIRGVSTFAGPTKPLIFIDGVEASTGDLSALPPEAIESFSILKDATATALYGARGANGVMLVTTRRGKNLEKAKINVRIQNTISAPTRFVELADGVSNMLAYNEAILTRNPEADPMFSDDKIQGTIEGRNPYVYPNVDWQEYMFKDMSMNQAVNLNVTGGGNRVDYFVSASFNNDNGMLQNNGQNTFDNNISNKRYSFQANINSKLTEDLKIGLKINSQIRNYSGSSSSTGDIYGSIFSASPVLFAPVVPNINNEEHITFGNKSGGPTPASNGSIYENPYAKMVSGYKNVDASTVITTFTLNQDLHFITEGLSVSGLVSFKNYSTTEVRRYYDPFYYEVQNVVENDGEYTWDYLVVNKGKTALNTKTGTGGDRFMNLQAAINYSRKFGAFDVASNLIYLQRDYNNNNPDGFYNSLPQRNQGFAGRMTLAYDDRYLAEVNFGYNGSENFKEGMRYGFFPSAALGYIISNENFWQPISEVVTNLKLRASYGLVGNSFTSPRFPYITNVNLSGRGYTFGANWQTSAKGAKIVKYGTADASWEVGQKMNAGIDLTLWDRLTIVADVFREDRNDIFMTRNTIPAETGVTGSIKPTANLGKVRNEGFDCSINYQHVINSDFTISVKGNFTYAKNELLARDEPQLPYPYLSDIGHPLNREKGLIAIGLFKDEADVANSPEQTYAVDVLPGDIKYKDLNDDGRIDDLDKTQIGDPRIPQITYGFGTSVKYKKFDFSIFFQGVAKTSIALKDIHPFGGTYYSVFKFIADDHWSVDSPNPGASYPRLSNGKNANNHQMSTYWLRDGAFCRLKNAEVGFSHKFLRLYLSGQNLLTFSKFKLWDPELGSGRGLSYPNLKMVTIGAQLNF